MERSAVPVAWNLPLATLALSAATCRVSFFLRVLDPVGQSGLFPTLDRRPVLSLLRVGNLWTRHDSRRTDPRTSFRQVPAVLNGDFGEDVAA